MTLLWVRALRVAVLLMSGALDRRFEWNVKPYFHRNNIDSNNKNIMFASVMNVALGVDIRLWATPYTVDSRYREVQGTLWNTSRYPYLDISDLQNWGKKLIRLNTFNKYMKYMCNWTLELRDILKILWKRGDSSFPQYFSDFHFEISGYSR